MRSTRVIAVLLLMLLLLLSIRLTIVVIIPASSANRMLDHRIKSFVHASHANITSRRDVRREVLALLLRRVRESRLRRWA
jgi:hypothetical protein